MARRMEIEVEDLHSGHLEALLKIGRSERGTARSETQRLGCTPREMRMMVACGWISEGPSQLKEPVWTITDAGLAVIRELAVAFRERVMRGSENEGRVV